MMSKQTVINAKKDSLVLKFVTNETILKLKKDTKLFDKFADKNQAFVHNLASKFSPRDSFDYADYFQTGLIALYKAVDKFDLIRAKKEKSSLSTFAYVCIYNDILQLVNKKKKISSKEVSIEKFIRKYDDDSSAEYYEFLFLNQKRKGNTHLEDEIIHDIVIENYANSLEGLHKKIFNYRFVDGLKHKEIAKKLGLNIHTYRSIFYYSIYPKLKKSQQLLEI